MSSHQSCVTQGHQTPSPFSETVQGPIMRLSWRSRWWGLQLFPFQSSVHGESVAGRLVQPRPFQGQNHPYVHREFTVNSCQLGFRVQRSQDGNTRYHGGSNCRNCSPPRLPSQGDSCERLERPQTPRVGPQTPEPGTVAREG